MASGKPYLAGIRLGNTGSAVVSRIAVLNHVGPGQNCGFIVPDLVAKVRGWRPGTNLTVGNLDSARGYTDVRAVVAAYELPVESTTAEPRHLQRVQRCRPSG